MIKVIIVEQNEYDHIGNLLYSMYVRQVFIFGLKIFQVQSEQEDTRVAEEKKVGFKK